MSIMLIMYSVQLGADLTKKIKQEFTTQNG